MGVRKAVHNMRKQAILASLFDCIVVGFVGGDNSTGLAERESRWREFVDVSATMYKHGHALMPEITRHDVAMFIEQIEPVLLKRWEAELGPTVTSLDEDCDD